MLDVNNVVISGRSCGEVRMFDVGGTPKANFRLASNERFKRNDEWHDDTTYVDVDAWGRTAEFVDRNIMKGSEVLIVGSLKLDQWEDKETGDRRQKFYVKARDVEVDFSKKHKSQNSTPSDNQDDDVPF